MKDLITSLGNDGLKSAYSLIEALSLYLTIFLAIALIVTAIILNAVNKEKLKSFKNLALGIVIGYAVTLSSSIFFLRIARMNIKGEIDKNFYLIVGFFALLLVYAITLVITKLKNKKAFKICGIVGGAVSTLYLILLVIFLPTVSEEYEPLSKVGMYIFTIILVVVTILGVLFDKKSSEEKSSTKALSYAGITIALSFALSYVKLFSMPQGGSVTLASMLPLVIYAYIFGARKGVFVGVIYGLLQCMQSPQIYHPLQVVIDYPLAFGMIGLAGIVSNIKGIKSPFVKFIIGASIACVLRYLCHVVSGYYVFSSWAMEGYTALSWAFVYNLYLIAELGIMLVAGGLIYSSKSFVKQIENIK